MSLVPDYAVSSSESSTDSENEEPQRNVSATQPPATGPRADDDDDDADVAKLPTPGFAARDAAPRPSALTSSVFKNPFVEAERAERAMLERHVKMVTASERRDRLNGKKVCWNYRKGRCRFGHNCKFAHDSDLQGTAGESGAVRQETVVCQGRRTPPQPTTAAAAAAGETEGDDAAVAARKRKRPGLSRGLVPGKKVMRSYFKQKT